MREVSSLSLQIKKFCTPNWTSDLVKFSSTVLTCLVSPKSFQARICVTDPIISRVEVNIAIVTCINLNINQLPVIASHAYLPVGVIDWLSRVSPKIVYYAAGWFPPSLCIIVIDYNWCILGNQTIIFQCQYQITCRCFNTHLWNFLPCDSMAHLAASPCEKHLPPTTVLNTWVDCVVTWWSLLGFYSLIFLDITPHCGRKWKY